MGGVCAPTSPQQFCLLAPCVVATHIFVLSVPGVEGKPTVHLTGTTEEPRLTWASKDTCCPNFFTDPITNISNIFQFLFYL